MTFYTMTLPILYNNLYLDLVWAVVLQPIPLKYGGKTEVRFFHWAGVRAPTRANCKSKIPVPHLHQFKQRRNVLTKSHFPVPHFLPTLTHHFTYFYFYLTSKNINSKKAGEGCLLIYSSTTIPPPPKTGSG